MVNKSEKDVYQPICQIGKGACGAVYLVRNTDNKKLYALKKIQLDESRKTRTREAVQREANIMAEMKHPHIVSYHDSFYVEEGEHSFLYIVQDYCDGGTLEDRIQDAILKKHYIPEKQVIQWFLQISMAVRYLHSKRVLHRDLKTANVFMNKSGTICKLGDFGIAKSLDKIEVASTCVGTPCYLSPEMCQDIPYSSKADVWALGCMLYEMLALKPAFDANNLVSLFYKIVKGSYDPIPEFYSEEMNNLVASILVKSADERPSAGGILTIPYTKAELLKYIEERELLRKRKLPTRQGSRPYSTSCLSRSLIAFFEEQVANGAEIPVIPQKRATSCRPAGSEKLRERSLLSARGKHGRVSTIPEEPEDDAARNLRILQQIEANNMEVIQEAQDTPREPPQTTLKEVKDNKKVKSVQESDKQKTRGTPTLKNAHVPESPRQQANTNNKSSSKSSSSVSDNKGPKRGSTPSGEHKDHKDQKMAKKSSQQTSSKTSSSNNNRSGTPHKNKDGKKDSGASRETSKTPSKDKDPKVLSKSAKVTRENNSTMSNNKKGAASSNNRASEVAKSHKQLTNSSPNIGANGDSSVATVAHSNSNNNKENSCKTRNVEEDFVPEDIEMLDKSLTLDLVSEKLLALSQSEPNMVDSARQNKVLRKNSQNKGEYGRDSPNIVVIEEVTPIAPDSSRSLPGHSDTSLPMVTGTEHLVSHSNESLPPIHAKPGGMVVKEPSSQQQHWPKFSNQEASSSSNLPDSSIRQVGAITKTVKQMDGLPKLIIQNEASASRRSSGRRGSLRRSSGKHGKRRTSGKLKINVSDSVGDRPSTRDSLLSIPYDPSFDYYSDDFDDLETESDISEDLEVPEEEMTDLRKHVRKMSTQTFELLADVEEDLPGGQLGRDEDYLDDFEDDMDEYGDDFDEILSAARDICNDLDAFHRQDEIIMDHESRRPSANVVLKQQFIDAMGKEKYDKVKQYFDNNDEIEIKKLEKMVGKEHLKTALMMKGKK